MKRARSRSRLVAVLALALGLTVGLTVSDSAMAKKKGGGKTAFVAGTPGAIPNGPTTYTPFGTPATNPVPLRATATVGNKFKKKTVGDVDATISLSGTPAGGTTCGSMCDIVIRLTAPNGATTALIQGFGGFGGGAFSATGNLISNLTLSDETSTRICGGPNGPPPPPPCGDPNATLLAPYTGTAQPFGFLNLLDGSPMKGTWTLTAFDICGAGGGVCGASDQGTASVTGWSLKITPATAPK
jgi:hypothetical protein